MFNDITLSGFQVLYVNKDNDCIRTVEDVYTFSDKGRLCNLIGEQKLSDVTERILLEIALGRYYILKLLNTDGSISYFITLKENLGMYNRVKGVIAEAIDTVDPYRKEFTVRTSPRKVTIYRKEIKNFKEGYNKEEKVINHLTSNGINKDSITFAYGIITVNKMFTDVVR